MRRAAVVVALVGLIAAGLAIRASTRDSEDRLNLRVVALGDRPGGNKRESIDASVERAIEWLEAKGLRVSVGTSAVMYQTGLDETLITNVDAADPCHASGWRSVLSEAALMPKPNEVVLVFGGTIRSQDQFRVLGGLTCTPDPEQACNETPAATTAVILFDGQPPGRVDLDVTIAHELSHALGLEHTDARSACGDGLESASVDPQQVPVNLMGPVVHSEEAESDFPLERVTLNDVRLTDRQLEAMLRFLSDSRAVSG